MYSICYGEIEDKYNIARSVENSLLRFFNITNS